jgi:hypothetical protein
MAQETIDPTALQPEQTAHLRHRRWHRTALALTLLLIVVVIVTMPIAIRSMGTVLFGRQSGELYDLESGKVVTPADADAVAAVQSYFNLAVLDIDEGKEVVTLGVSGHRICPGPCPTAKVTLFALGDNAGVRRGLPPSATLTLQPTDELYTQTLQLPIQGQPSLYPFDVWRLTLGIVVDTVGADGKLTPMSPEFLRDHAVLTVQNQLPDFLMQAPVRVDTNQVTASSDPVRFVVVQALSFDRPDYLKVLSLILVVLISVSGVLALLTRSINDLVLGVGGLILGIWGVRSIMVPQPVPVVTAIDLSLSTVILLLLLGLAVRAAIHFHHHSELPWSKQPTRPHQARRRRPPHEPTASA